MRQLVELAREGDREAFGQLAALEINRLNAIARLVLGDADLADDAVQETLVRCWQNLPRLRDVDRFKGWLNQILMRAVADQRRGRRRVQVGVRRINVEPSAGDTSMELADRDEIERAFAQLSHDHRAVVVLHHYAGLALPEVAKALGIPLGTAKSRHRYAISSLRAVLDAGERVQAAREAQA